MRRYSHYIIIILSLILFQNCGSSVDAAKVEKTNQLVESRQFEIEHDWLNPMSGSRINLIGNPNFIRFKKDSVNLFLPFFGERFSGGGYNNEGGIIYNGPLKDLEISRDNKNTQIIEFSARQDSEDLDFTINIYPEGTVNTRVNSSQRSFISYQGKIGKLKEKAKE
ncbi:protein of unknown function [Salegentibacter holothuriorum]|uniref:DUF4251 domain-containing protein n=1 Tax=Salegentibacter holothuriorum TaxID=241145 RepID=A0A1T5AB23_9FLAO|nr:DUF4251 domain-containing protein [Salegentibacter holothuriorum]SKB32221.1 protein of unknown function [Salegentibacter holothuriorum]